MSILKFLQETVDGTASIIIDSSFVYAIECLPNPKIYNKKFKNAFAELIIHYGNSKCFIIFLKNGLDTAIVFAKFEEWFYNKSFDIVTVVKEEKSLYFFYEFYGTQSI